MLTEPVCLAPAAAVVEELREHGGELAIAYVVWHDLAFCVRLLRAARTLTEEGRAAVPSGHAAARAVFRDVLGGFAGARKTAVRDGLTPIKLVAGRGATRGAGWMQATLSAD